MFSKNTMRIIGFLLKRPAGRYNVNQLSKELGISVGSAHKIVKALSKGKILKSENLGNAIFYALNLENKESRKICEIFLIEDKNKELAKNQIAKVYSTEIENFPAKALVLFGSILTKKEKAADVDALFIIENRKKVEKVTNFCLEASKTKTKPIIPLIMTKGDLKIKLKEKNPVVMEIIKTGIVLSGEGLIVEVLSDV